MGAMVKDKSYYCQEAECWSIFYYICLGIFIGFPILSCAIGIVFSQLTPASNIIPICSFFVIYVVFLFFVYIYVINILALNNCISEEITSFENGEFT